MAEAFAFLKAVATNPRLRPSQILTPPPSRVPWKRVSVPSTAMQYVKYMPPTVPMMLQSRRSLCIPRAQAKPIQESIKSKIASSPVVIYSKTWCPYCLEVKSLFTDLGVRADVVELDELDGPEMQVQDALRELTGQSTVPNVFVGIKISS
eukprot:TRINITY_DN1419_c0_g1_i2.p1 TRINITY_DN1419_c0_g1~~TRINITY_DN1419_c0_g1_i2.p1  ORF type:complete len:150 (+),score=26.00 TRINITY_DN1419_c0_g1_i2:180-629(+)